MKNGVPWDVAAAMSDEESLAASIAFFEMEGGKWNWRTMTPVREG